MQFKIELFVREHRNGFFTLRVVGTPRLSVYAASVEEGRQDLALVIGDRIERTHPSHQAELFSLGAERREELVVPEALPVEREGEQALTDMRFSVLLADNRGFTSLWYPRPDLHQWIARKGSDWEEASRELLSKSLSRMSTAARLELRYEKREWTETLVIEAEPPALSRFSGKNRHLVELPPRGPKEEKDEDELDADGKKKKKRPETPTFRKIGVPLSALAEERDLEHAHERSREVSDLLRLLAAPGEKAIAVIGPSGTGKSTILSELVYRLRAEGSPKQLRERPVWFADASRLIAGDGWFGDWQRQTLDAIGEAEAAEIIWYIGPLLPLLDAGKSIGSDQNVAQLLKPYLSGKRITVVGEATLKDFTKLEVRDAGFARAFQTYRIAEPEPAEAREILTKVGAELAELEGLELDAGGLEAIFELCRRYVSDGSHLGAAISFLRRTAEQAAARNQKKIGRSEAVAAFSAETGLPERLIRDDLPLDPLAVRKAFTGRLIGQDEAIDRMTDLIAVIKAGLSDLTRPLGSFLFVGPTGVGKTETAKALAAYLFGGEHRLARFDMSEYVGWDAVHRFLGDSRTEGKLVEAIRRRPFSVVLLDEIEKAHPAIFDVLLQVLGEARLTDESGRIADFKNAVIIMTSNLGVETFKHRAGFDARAELREHFVKEAEKFFRPELFNRIDHLVPFAPLEAAAIEEITQRELEKMLSREGLRRRDVTLTIEPRAVGWLAARGVEPRYGARPLKRVLERSLAMPLARYVSRSRGEGATSIAVKLEDDALVFEASGSTEARAPSVSLRPLIEKIDTAIFRLQRWQSSGDYLDLAHEIRLLDQLSQSRLFWTNREAAEKRVAGSAAARILLADWEKLDVELGGLQDVAFEAHAARDPAPLSMITEELQRLNKQAAELELRLFERRFISPDRAILYLGPAGNVNRFIEEMVELYAAIALESGWDLTAYVAKSEDDGKTLSWDEVVKLEQSASDQWQRRLNRLTDQMNGVSILALVFRGPHAASFLFGETGQHTKINGTENQTVRVEFVDAGASAGLIHVKDLRWPANRLRTMQENKNVLQDFALNYHLALEVRRSRLYQRFMRARIYHAVFGEAGVTWARAFEEK